MTGRGYIFYTRMSIQGGTAIAYGLASIAIGLFLHFHAIWAESVRLSRYADAGRIISMLLFIVSLSYVIWHIGMFNR
jgi:hypothetical protein